MEINNKFTLKDQVKIKELNIRGLIVAIYISIDYGFQYSVRYFKGGDIRTNYFFEFELEKFEEVEIKGFK